MRSRFLIRRGAGVEFRSGSMSYRMQLLPSPVHRLAFLAIHYLRRKDLRCPVTDQPVAIGHDARGLGSGLPNETDAGQTPSVPTKRICPFVLCIICVGGWVGGRLSDQVTKLNNPNSASTNTIWWYYSILESITTNDSVTNPIH
jgi:hypothetical protein